MKVSGCRPWITFCLAGLSAGIALNPEMLSRDSVFWARLMRASCLSSWMTLWTSLLRLPSPLSLLLSCRHCSCQCCCRRCYCHRNPPPLPLWL